MKSAFKYISVFCVAFILSGAAAYYAISLFTQSAGEIILPELRGKNIIYVLETLTNMGLNAKLYGTHYDDTHPRYAVISQDPLPGSTIKKGRDVVIYISKGKKENIMPDLRQKQLTQALILLEKNEFGQGHISYTYSTKTKKGSVISQYPEPFSSSQKQTPCNLLVSRGAPDIGYIMPDLSGTEPEKASLRLEKLNLSISKIISNNDAAKPFGIVLSHLPEPGSYVTKNSPITLVVNYLEKDRQMAPERLTGSFLLRHTLGPGFLNRHVRVETDLLGPILDLYNDYMKPGEQIQLLLPANTKSLVNIYIDQELVKAITIDPWKKDHITGDNLWESSPLQFYQQTSPDWETN